MTDESKMLPNEPSRFIPATLDEVLMFTTKLGASDVTIQSEESIFAEISGRLHRITHRKLSNTEVGEIINAIYGPNGTIQLLSGEDVDTHYEFRPTRTERYRFRVNATGCLVKGHEGIQITMRTIPSEPPLLADMNLPKEVLDAVEPEQGVVYVTGATGSGKSTLLAAIIRDIAQDPESHRKILTYESPIEFVFDTIHMETAVVSQSEIPRNLRNFAYGVRNALRRKPRLILVGEARDPETISAVIEAALTGHPVYTTLHSNGVAETIRRLVTSFPADERHGRTLDILETIRLVIWQKLVAKVGGGRVALREYLIFDENIRDRLISVQPETVTQVTRELCHQFGRPMIRDAEEKFKEGLISERDFKILEASSRMADHDAGLKK
jgi:defect-in-organelle-trafficking protein DotB